MRDRNSGIAPQRASDEQAGVESPRPVLSERHARHGRVTSLLVIAAISLLTAGGTLLARVTPASGPLLETSPDDGSRSPVAATSDSDTVVVYGPKRFVVSRSGSEDVFVERIQLPQPTAGARYLLKVELGSQPLGHRDRTAAPRAAAIRVNGREIYSSSSVQTGQAAQGAQPGPEDIRTLVVPLEAEGSRPESSALESKTASRPTSGRDAAAAGFLVEQTITVEVRARGEVGSSVSLYVLAAADPNYLVFGPQQVLRVGSSPTLFSATFPVPSTAATPYAVVVNNGLSNGTRRVSSATIALDGVALLAPGDVTSGVARVVKPITLSPGTVQQIDVAITGPLNSLIDVRLRATDVTPPSVTITSPLPNQFTKQLQFTVTGTAQDETAVRVTVNGVQATVSRSGMITTFAAVVPLAVEGTNTLTVVATDAAGFSSSVTRTITRDTQSPVLALTAPTPGLITRLPSTNVAGTVSDATPVLVNVNGIPLPVDAAGAFTGTAPLSEGPNFLIVTAIDQAGNTTSLSPQVTLDSQAPALTVTSPLNGSTTTSPTVPVTGTVVDATSVAVTVNDIAAVVTGSAFAGSANLVSGSNTITVRATDAAGNQSIESLSVTLTGTDPSLPPDPRTVAPPNDPTVPTNIATSTAFLYSGANPIQTGVSAGVIDAQQVSVLRGRVLEGVAPLSGVTVEVLDHPEFGQTLTRADGAYDLALNGGRSYTLIFSKTGFLPAQRKAAPARRDFEHIADLSLVRPDSKVTVVSPATATQFEVAESSVNVDADGVRKTTVLFAPGTQTTITLADGSTQTLSTLSVRATEYTVGAAGPSNMPAELPPTSAYTYAFGLSIDEADAAGAVGISFSSPVTMYVENFLHFPTGTPIPLGSYVRQESQWRAEDNGIVLTLLGVVGGLAQLDTDGDNLADAPVTLAAWGITPGEQQVLGSRFTAGQSLSRIAVSALGTAQSSRTRASARSTRGPRAAATVPSPQVLDPNFPWDSTNRPPGVKGASSQKQLQCKYSTTTPGSICEVQNQVLGERIPLVGTRLSLNYRSRRVREYLGGQVIHIPLSDGTLSPRLSRIHLQVSIAGQLYEAVFPAAPNLSHTYIWDGMDGYGRPAMGGQTATVRVGYEYPPSYGGTAPLGGSGGGPGSARVWTVWPVGPLPISITRYGAAVIAWAESKVDVRGSWDARAQGLGGWTLDVHHLYDPSSRMLQLGSGEERVATLLGPSIATVAGTGTPGTIGDGGPATAAQIDNPQGLAFGPDGSMYIAQATGQVIRRVDPAGIISTVPGTPHAGLIHPQGISVGPDGALYIADYFNHRILRVDATGAIATVAGTGVEGSIGDGGPATQARLRYPTMATIGPDGCLYIADGLNYSIRRVGTDGVISTVIGGLGSGYAGDGGPASQARISTPQTIAFAQDGTLLFSDYSNNRVRRVDHAGVISTIAGNGSASGPSGDGGLATLAAIWRPLGLAVGSDGALYISEDGGHVIRRVGLDGIISTIAGAGTAGFNGDGIPARQAMLNVPDRMAFGPDGRLYVADGYNHRVRRLEQPLPGFTPTNVVVPSEDASELYEFTSAGRHLRTLDALTNAVIHSFTYDAAGWLVGATDRDGRTTTIQRNAAGQPVAIVAPSGEVTSLATNAGGYLTRVSDPQGNVTTLTYAGSGGLLATYSDPRGKLSQITYDSVGRLIINRDASLATQMFAGVSDISGARTVTHTSAAGRNSTYLTELLSTGDTRLFNTAADGTTSSRVIALDGSDSLTAADGTISRTTVSGDPRFQMAAPILTSGYVRLPSGTKYSVTAGRAATLSNPADPLSILTLRDSAIVNGQRWLSVYDAAQRTLSATSPMGRASTTTLTALGRVSQVALPGITALSATYDASGNLQQTSQGSRVWQYQHDAAGRVTRVTDPLLLSTSFAYDASGRLTTHTLANNQAITFTYDSSGNLASLTPPGKPAHRFVANALNLDSVYTPPAVAGTGSTTYLYNADRQLTNVNRPGGSTIALSYDAGGRLASMTTARGSTTLAYDAGGRLGTVTGPGGLSTSYSYDGSLVTSERAAGLFTANAVVTYDNDFRANALFLNFPFTVPVSYQYLYDADGLLTQAGALAVARDPSNGQIAGTSVGAVSTARSYSSFGELAADTARGPAGTLYGVSYQRDALGRIVQLAETVQGQVTTYAYTYTGIGRLGRVTRNGATVATYSYDANGNRTRLVAPTGTINATYDAQDRLLSYGTTTYQYTPAGELLSKQVGAQTTTYTYDAMGQLLRVVLPNGNQIDYVIDALNRRVGKRVNGTLMRGFFYVGKRLLAETDGSGQLATHFVYGTRGHVPEYMVSGGATYRLLTDHLGSVRLVVNAATGAVAQRLDYDEFGRVTLNTNPGFQPFGFAGGHFDEDTQLVRFGARDYDAVTGRWTAKDPIGFAGGSANLFAYVDQEPINSGDPTGLSALKQAGGCIGRVIFGGGKGEGCGDAGTDAKVPDLAPGSVVAACRRHDRCYDTLGASKLMCDLELAVNVAALNVLQAVPPPFAAMVGATYGLAVVKYGGDAYKKAQERHATPRPPTSARTESTPPGGVIVWRNAAGLQLVYSPIL